MTRSLRSLREVEVADVHKAGHLAATLRRTDDGVVFAYQDDYRGPAVATTLPVSGSPLLTPAGALPPFFTGLLPEGRRLSVLRRAVKTSADDELSLLLAVGHNLVGDVQVVPQGDAPELTSTLTVGTWSEVRFSDLLADESRLNPDRAGLAGVQDKVSAAMISLPVRRRHESYILKLDPPEFPHLVANEAAMLTAADMARVPAVGRAVVHDGEGRPGLLVTRFDRTAQGSRAVEDGCQVMGRYPADKYAVAAEDVCATLAGQCDAPLVAARTLLRLLAFAFLTGNGDMHAKNLAVVEVSDGAWRVTPGYDLPSSYPYGDTTMALPVNGKRGDDIGWADFRELGRALGVTQRAVDHSLDELVASVSAWLPLLDELPFDARIRHKWQRLVTYRAGRLTAGR